MKNATRIGRWFLAFLVVLSTSCSGSLASAPGVPHRVGARTISQVTETLSLAAGTDRSQPIAAATYDNIGIAVRSTGTASGTWTIHYSNDYQPGVDSLTDDTKWDTYTLSTTPPAAAGSGQTFGVVVDSYEFAWIRTYFVNSGGTGSATIITNVKGN